MIVKVALAPANTVWELKLVVGLITGGEATAGEMAAQNSAVPKSKRQFNFISILVSTLPKENPQKDFNKSEKIFGPRLNDSLGGFAKRSRKTNAHPPARIDAASACSRY